MTSSAVRPTPHWNYRAFPDADHQHGACQLDEHGARLATDAGYFPTAEEAEAWAINRKWKRYELSHVVSAVSS